MPLKLIRQNYWQVVGKGSVLLSNSPSLDQLGELYTGRIVEEAALLSKAPAIIAKEIPNPPDSITSQAIKSEFEANTHRLVEELGIMGMLVVRGKNDPGIEIRAAQAESETGITIDIVKDTLGTDLELKLGSEKSNSQDGSGNIQTIWIGLGPEERGLRKELVVSRIADLIGVINGKLGWSESDKRTSDILD